MEDTVLMDELNELVAKYDTVRRYARENDRIDELKEKAGIMPQFMVHGGEYATLYLHPEYESRWKGTFYDKERVFLSTTLRNAHSLSLYHYFEKLGKSHPCNCWIIGYCDSASAEKNGVMIRLTDPYGEVTLPTFLGMPGEMMFVYVEKMLLCNITFDVDGPHVNEVATLPFTLRERITKDHPLYETLTEPPFSGTL